MVVGGRYSIIDACKHTCTHADAPDTQKRKWIVTAGSEKGKWKQLLWKGWEK